MAVPHIDTHGDSMSTAAARSTGIGYRVWIVLTAVLIGFVAVWWFAGGTFVEAPSANAVGVAVSIGEEASFGFPLTADGGGASLRSVSARVTPEATVEWTVYQQSGVARGFGSWHGPLEPAWPVKSVDASTVSPNDAHATHLVATVRSSTPGVFRVSDIAIEYQSGWRTRIEETAFVGCVLVTPAGRSVDELRASRDPLWQEYEACPANG